MATGKRWVRVLEEVEVGNIAFNAPKQMNIREEVDIHLMLDLTKTIDELKQLIKAKGEKEGARIRVYDRMEARLTGMDFAITAITPETTAVSRRESTEWRWKVRPMSAGPHSLHLTLSVWQRSSRTTPQLIWPKPATRSMSRLALYKSSSAATAVRPVPQWSILISAAEPPSRESISSSRVTKQ